jgi:hypothetical protein
VRGELQFFARNLFRPRGRNPPIWLFRYPVINTGTSIKVVMAQTGTEPLVTECHNTVHASHLESKFATLWEWLYRGCRAERPVPRARTGVARTNGAYLERSPFCQAVQMDRICRPNPASSDALREARQTLCGELWIHLTSTNSQKHGHSAFGYFRTPRDPNIELA